MLLQALSNTFLKPPGFERYFDGAFSLASGETISIDESDGGGQADSGSES
jgi:hypothetical protein